MSALLPRELRKKCCCVSIKNIPKNKCFFYCVAAALCENTKNKYNHHRFIRLPSLLLIHTISLQIDRS